MDRNARRALVGLAVIVVVAMLLGLRSCLTLYGPNALVAEPSSANDQIIVLDGETMFVPPGTVGSKIGSWLDRGTSGANAFFVEDDVFVAGSDSLSPEARARLDRLVRVLRSDDKLSVRLFVTDYEGANDADKDRLASSRAQRLRTEMIAGGVPADRVATAVTPLSVRAAGGDGPRPTIVVVLAKRGGTAGR
jgi:hypothetical protein